MVCSWCGGFGLVSVLSLVSVLLLVMDCCGWVVFWNQVKRLFLFLYLCYIFVVVMIVVVLCGVLLGSCCYLWVLYLGGGVVLLLRSLVMCVLVYSVVGLLLWEIVIVLMVGWCWVVWLFMSVFL